MTARYYGETAELLAKYAWYNKNAQDQTWPVGMLKPNDFGLFDAHGNVWTWCQESYKEDAQSDKASDDKEDEAVYSSALSRVLRGSSFDDRAAFVRCAFRIWNGPEDTFDYVGFRPVRTIKP